MIIIIIIIIILIIIIITVMIVCPASMRLTWAEELQKWAPEEIPPTDIHVIMESNDKWGDEGPKKRWNIISYRMLMILGRYFEQK